MYPTLFEIGGLEVTTFGLMMLLAFLSATWILSLQLGRRGLEPKIAWDVLAWTAVGGILGAKLYYLALHWPELVTDPVEIFSRGGLVWYGGFIGGALAFYWQVRRRGLPLGALFDSAAPALPLGYAFGRMGCFLVGDDYGLPTDSALGVVFPDRAAMPSTAGYLRTVGAEIPSDVPDAALLAVHPTQLYEIAAALAMFAILWRASTWGLRPGRLFGLFLALYGVERFLIEFLRAKDDRFILGLTTSQMMSLLLLALAAYLWFGPGRGAQLPAARQAGAQLGNSG